MRSLRFVFGLGLLASMTAAGCASDDGNSGPYSGDGDGVGDGDGDGDGGTGGDGDGDGTGDGDGDGSGDGDGDGDGGPLLDVGSGDGDGDGDGDGGGDGDGDGDGDGEGETGCEGVDFLFVIDNSGSMGGEQNALIASFPSFINSIETKLATLEADDYHIMVTDTDAANFEPDPACLIQCQLNPNGTCDGASCALYTPLCMILCSEDPYAECGGEECSALAGCDEDECVCELGAGVITQPDGDDCGIAGDKNYIQNDQPDLNTKFECIATVGTDGSGSEIQMGAMVAAVSDPMNQPNECNDSFLRDDAVLVVTVITDEEDTNSNGNPADWKDALVAAKGGEEERVVVLGLVGDTNTPDAVCQPIDGNSGADESPRLREFVSSVDNNVLGSVCEDDYADFFAEAVELIEETCDEFPVPQ